MKMYFQMNNVENSLPITARSDPAFLLLVQRAVLLGLKEAGHIEESQHRHVEETLLKKYHGDVIKYD